MLKIGLPKGSLQESTLNMFKKAGYSINISSRSPRWDFFFNCRRPIWEAKVDGTKCLQNRGQQNQQASKLVGTSGRLRADNWHYLPTRASG